MRWSTLPRAWSARSATCNCRRRTAMARRARARGASSAIAHGASAVLTRLRVCVRSRPLTPSIGARAAASSYRPWRWERCAAAMSTRRARLAASQHLRALLVWPRGRRSSAAARRRWRRSRRRSRRRLRMRRLARPRFGRRTRVAGPWTHRRRLQPRRGRRLRRRPEVTTMYRGCSRLRRPRNAAFERMKRW